MNCFLQLLYEFNKVCGEDVVGAMEKNWQRVCQTLLPDCDDLTPANERKVLQIDISQEATDTTYHFGYSKFNHRGQQVYTLILTVLSLGRHRFEEHIHQLDVGTTAGSFSSRKQPSDVHMCRK